MNDVVTINSRGDRVTLDAVWREAERLGRIEVDHRIGNREYRVTIRLAVNGSTVWARGEDRDIIAAVQAAIHAARGFIESGGKA